MKSIARFYDKDWKETESEQAEYIQLERRDKGKLVFQILLAKKPK